MSKENTLEKEFVPYQEALELKEIGFDEPCFALYGKSEGHLYMIHNDKFDVVDNIHFIKAPTFSQAFKWFREKGFEVSVYSKNNVDWFFLIKKDVITTNDVVYKNEEDAELACLRKLIEIVKNEKTN